MAELKTAERVSHRDSSDNYVFQRSKLAYYEAAELLSGKVLELGTGSGYGLEIIAPHCSEFLTLDKFQSEIPDNEKLSHVKFKMMAFPPLTDIPSNTFDAVISFQVIEHIEDDGLFVEEVERVLKPEGQFIVTTPNKPMSLTRNPWHIREYTAKELEDLLLKHFSHVDKKGVFGNEKIMQYYRKNAESVRKITRFDIFDLQHRLPRKFLQIPYDILNRLNRKKLLKDNTQLVNEIAMQDYYLDEVGDACFDLFYVAKSK